MTIRVVNQPTENLRGSASRNFRDLSEEQRRIGLWSFPIIFKPNGDRYNKKPLVKWKALQDRPPTDAELKAWYANPDFQQPAAGTQPARRPA